MYILNQGEFLGHISRRFDTHQGLTLIETVYHTYVYQGSHFHQNTHLTLFLQGGTFEKRKHLSDDVRPGNLRFYYSGEIHQNLNTRFPSKNINLDISADFFSKQQLDEADIDRALVKNPHARAILLKMYKEALLPDRFSNDSILMLFHQLIDPTTSFQRKKKPAWVIQLNELLQDCWSEPTSLAELSRILKVNPITISKHFPRYFGCTLSEYIRRVKVSRALQRIRQPAVSLTALAYECGFADQSHFTRILKEQTGFLPKQLQKL
ncbi:helix-turn-helix domain-containing protein [Spirosoma sp. HMF4905]|uniref:Helix-turn-helix domain-containing protein n=1 Tax=Spirosoma arboris TaxID=2682092 RepID=A0A7K1SHV0_9BACT|nr:helix-turn-helix transcriptional regulator [Spirosoma arboris]MVM33389.1 helix-turn-helix domain-containing protein [Spirosoma arboris]